MFGAGKHQHLKPVVTQDQMSEKFTLLITIHTVNSLLDLLCGRIAWSDLNQGGVVEKLLRQRLNLVRESG